MFTALKTTSEKIYNHCCLFQLRLVCFALLATCALGGALRGVAKGNVSPYGSQKKKTF